MIKLNFLGRGSAFNVKEGNTSAYIKIDKNLILLDCGESIFERIINNNLLQDIETINIIITHLNSDHVGSLSSLIFYCYYIKKITPNIYFPGHEIRQLLSIMGHNSEYYWVLLQDGASIHINNINFKFIPVTHSSKLNCYAIYMTDDDSSIYYSGDSNNIPENILNQLNDISLLYQDTCMAEYEGNIHLSLRKLKDLIPGEYRNKVYCMHIDNDELIVKVKEQGFNVVEIDS